MAQEKKNILSRFVSSFISGTSSNVEELGGRLLSLVRDQPLCGQTPWKLREVERLISKGAPINACSNDLFTALHTACLNNDLVTAELLIRHGINVNAKDLNGSTPLHIAINKSPVSPALTTLLHENGANLNSKNRLGETPLHFAAMQEDPTCAKKLISMGADLFTPSKIRIIIDASPQNRPLVYAVRSGRLGLILFLLQCGDSFEDFSPQSLLFYGYSRLIHFEIVKLFVEAGLKVPRDLFLNHLDNLNKWPDSLKDWLCNPLPLQVLCMRAIRDSIGREHFEQITELCLPQKLKQRLKYDIEGFNLELECKVSSQDKSKHFFSFNIYQHKALYNQ